MFWTPIYMQNIALYIETHTNFFGRQNYLGIVSCYTTDFRSITLSNRGRHKLVLDCHKTYYVYWLLHRI